jgi:ubiquinone/menaquinone biosynthesis C-methylase UbiE
LLGKNWTHQYSREAADIIRDYPNGVVLDFGAGNVAPTMHYPNVLFHEAIHYPYTDVVSVLPKLPYRDGVFDAVISQAVFEHLPRPWETADELYRVLKPGGRIHVDTAFGQPYHADPCHFFNMTTQGVRQIFQKFQEKEVGIKAYQSAGWALRFQWDILLEHLKQGKWLHRIRELRSLLDSEDLDPEIDETGQQRLAAGVFFDGVKPT